MTKQAPPVSIGWIRRVRAVAFARESFCLGFGLKYYKYYSVNVVGSD